MSDRAGTSLAMPNVVRVSAERQGLGRGHNCNALSRRGAACAEKQDTRLARPTIRSCVPRLRAFDAQGFAYGSRGTFLR